MPIPDIIPDPILIRKTAAPRILAGLTLATTLAISSAAQANPLITPAINSCRTSPQACLVGTVSVSLATSGQAVNVFVYLSKHGYQVTDDSNQAITWDITKLLGTPAFIPVQVPQQTPPSKAAPIITHSDGYQAPPQNGHQTELIPVPLNDQSTSTYIPVEDLSPGMMNILGWFNTGFNNVSDVKKAAQNYSFDFQSETNSGGFKYIITSKKSGERVGDVTVKNSGEVQSIHSDAPGVGKIILSKLKKHGYSPHAYRSKIVRTTEANRFWESAQKMELATIVEDKNN